MKDVEPGSREWAESVAQEHLLLEREVAEVRKWWQEYDELGLPDYDGVALRIRRLRDRLAGHFADEQVGGFFRHLASSPQHSRRACQLEAEHARLLRRLESLQHRLESGACEGTPSCGVGDELDSFMDTLLEHEANENQILAESFGLELQVLEEPTGE